MKSWIDRQRNIIDYTLSSLLRRKRKNAALYIVYTLVVFLLSSVIFFTHSLKREAALLLKEAPEIVVQRIAAGRHELIPVSYLDKIKDIPGVSAAVRRLWGYYYDPISGANYTLMVSEDSPLENGRIAIGEGVSRSRLAVIGDSLEFRTYDGIVIELEVGRLIPAESALVSSDLILIGEDDFRRLFGISEELATDLVLKVRNPKEVPVVAVKIAEILPDTRQILRDEMLRTYNGVFDWRGGLLLVILSSGVLAFVIFAWDKASGLSAEERREIGILKAVGWETSDVIQAKIWEGLVVSLSAFSTGVLLGYAHVFFTSAKLFAPVLKGWALLYPQFKLTPFIDGSQLASLFFLAVVPYAVATIIPSWRAAIVDPDTVMR